MFVKFNDRERMNNKLLAYLFSLLFICGVAKADVNYGVSLMFGEIDTSGHELESGSASDKNSKSIEETFTEDHCSSKQRRQRFCNWFRLRSISVDIGSGKRTTLQLEQTLSPKQTLEIEVLLQRFQIC